MRVAIDDFGTGYSSLAYLHTLPVTTVKIDRSFTQRLGTADDSMPVVKAIIEMSRALGLRVVAEGVNDAPRRALVAELGCDSAQGFYWAPPIRPGSSRSGGAARSDERRSSRSAEPARDGQARCSDGT